MISDTTVSPRYPHSAVSVLHSLTHSLTSPLLSPLFAKHTPHAVGSRVGERGNACWTFIIILVVCASLFGCQSAPVLVPTVDLPTDQHSTESAWCRTIADRLESSGHRMMRIFCEGEDLNSFISFDPSVEWGFTGLCPNMFMYSKLHRVVFLRNPLRAQYFIERRFGQASRHDLIYFFGPGLGNCFDVFWYGTEGVVEIDPSQSEAFYRQFVWEVR